MEALHSLDSLRCLCAAAELGSFRAAARAVSLTPAAFSQRIKQLESQVGATLFRRTTRSLELTEAGVAVLPHAQSCLESASAVARAARGELGPAPTDLVIGTRHELGLSWILPELERVERELPWLTTHLYFGSGPDLLVRLKSHEVDAAVTSSRLDDPMLAASALHREDYVFVGAPKLVAKSPLRSKDDAEAHVIVDTTSDLPLFRYFRDAPRVGGGWRFGSVSRMGTIEAIRRRVLDGRGVAVLPLYLVSRDLEKRRLVRLFPRIKLLSDHFRLVYRAGDARVALFEAWAESMRRAPLR